MNLGESFPTGLNKGFQLMSTSGSEKTHSDSLEHEGPKEPNTGVREPGAMKQLDTSPGAGIMTAEEVAEFLDMSTSWVYRNLAA